jgi:hypothetical protein
MKKAVSTSIVKVIFVTSKVALLVLGIASSGYCNESFYKNHARGWHWYERNKESEEMMRGERKSRMWKHILAQQFSVKNQVLKLYFYIICIRIQK